MGHVKHEEVHSTPSFMSTLLHVALVESMEGQDREENVLRVRACDVQGTVRTNSV